MKSWMLPCVLALSLSLQGDAREGKQKDEWKFDLSRISDAHFTFTEEDWKELKPDEPAARDFFNPATWLGPIFQRALDSDKDGVISREEFLGTFDRWSHEWDTKKQGFLGPGVGGRPAGGERRQWGLGMMIGPVWIKDADADANAQVSPEEFAAMSARFFSKWDADANGSLTSDELREGIRQAAARPPSPSPADQQQRLPNPAPATASPTPAQP